MSSFIGHSLAALSSYSWAKSPASYARGFWLAWLVILASAPDFDHWVPGLRFKSPDHQQIRITHSILVCLVLSLGTALLLYLLGCKGHTLMLRSKQARLAAFSHLVPDLLTGVNMLPLLWPFSTELFKLPFGILPSAGQLNLRNYYLYKNLFIELGVLAPLVYSVDFIRHGYSTTGFEKVKIGGLLLIYICFIWWALNLSR